MKTIEQYKKEFIKLIKIWNFEIFRQLTKEINSDYENLDEIEKKKWVNIIDNFEQPFNEISINNYRSIKKQLEIKNLSDKKEIYFVGENGVGKTILLQAILLSLKKAEQDKFALLGVKQKEIEQISASLKIFEEIIFDYTYSLPNVFAYGIGRLRATDGSKIDKTGYATLFDRQNVLLQNPIKFLEKILLDELGKVGKIKHKKVIEMFTDILNIEENSEITILVKNKTNFIFKERGFEPEFDQLADGYRSILLILSDLLSRLIKNQPEITNIKEFKGIVLIDEIDMLLHPKWKIKIIKKLREKLPNIQWFFTTHSNTLIYGASSENSVFYRVKRTEKEGTTISQIELTPSKLSPNIILSSPFFDVPVLSENRKPEEYPTHDNYEKWKESLHVDKLYQEILNKQKLK